MNSIYGQNDNPNIQPNMIPYGGPMVPQGIGGDSLFQIAWRGKWFILVSTLIGLGAAFGYFQTAEKQYMAMSRVLVEKRGVLTDPGVVKDVGASSANFLPTQAILMTSPKVVEVALRDPNVLALPVRTEENHIGRLLGTLSATVGKNSDVIHVSASSPYPEDAPVIVNAVVEAYVRWHESNRRLSAEELLKSLNKQLTDCRAELNKVLSRKTRYEEINPQVLDSAKGGIVSQTLDLLKQELAAARVALMERESYSQALQQYESDPNKFRQYVYSSRSAATPTAEDNERSRVEQELHNTRLQLEEIEAGGVAAQRSRIELLKNRKKQLEERIVEMNAEFIRNQIALAKASVEDMRGREKKLTESYQNESTKVKSASGQSSEYTAIVHECDMLDEMYNTVLQKIKDLDLNYQVEGLNVHVLQRASQAGEPSSPQMARVMGIGLVLGLMVGGGLAFLRDWRDQRVRSADEITAILGVPILGAVPTIPRRGIIRRGPRSRLASHTREFEAYRSIRTALFFGAGREEAKTLLVTSPGPLEGKTTLVSNLGIAMARAGQKTLIVDADLRKPMQHRVFAKKGHGKGLVDVLAGTATLDEAIRPTEVPGLDVLECGPIVPNPSEVLGGDAFGAIFELLKGRYDRVLVDSPPVGIVADAQILAARCGLTLLVLRAQKSSRVITQRARDALSTVSARVVGAVVNDVPKGDNRYSHYGAGAYSYYHSGRESDGRKVVRKELPADVSPQAENGPSPSDNQQ
jgi:succinoglycan biosynthesis transport protein ExoP